MIMTCVAVAQVQTGERIYAPLLTANKPVQVAYHNPTSALSNVATSYREVDGVVPSNGLISNLAKLAQIRMLDDNWNGYGAKPIPQVVIQLAGKILMQLKHQPFLAPTGRDSIQFEYEKPWGDYFEIELFSDHINVYSVIEGQESEKTIAYSDVGLAELREGVESFCE